MPQIYIDGRRVAHLPQLTPEMKMKRIRVMLAHYRADEQLYRFYRNAYNTETARSGTSAA